MNSFGLSQLGDCFRILWIYNPLNVIKQVKLIKKIGEI